MNKNFFFAFLAMMLPLGLLAQFKINGTVTDQDSKQILAGANVTLGDQSTKTDQNGSYSFNGVKSGIQNLKISFIGYKSYENKIDVQGDRTLNVHLKSSTIITDEVVVRGMRAAATTPTTFQNLSREDIQKNNLGQDLPYLLNQTPSVVVSSDAGTGIGYTGIRIRGSDPTRVNVTINGIPYNDPESQGTYFVDIPDIASSVDNIQIQRGVGTSTNGAGAFGGSLNIQTTTRNDSAYVELNNSIGSFETVKNTLSVGTGLIGNKFTFDGRLSRIKSDGYIQPGFSNLKSYFLSAAFYGKNDIVRANVFSGAERTYQAWNGISQPQLLTDRRKNPFTYDDQTDNYTQDHYQVLYTHNFSPVLSSNVAFHYTWGRGYFEEYKESAKLKDYGLAPVIIENTTMTKSNLIRRRWLDNDFYGVTYSLNYRPVSEVGLTLGGAYNEYDGAHFGQVLWSQYNSNANFRDRYYDGKGFKTDFNIYGRADYRINAITLYGDLQYRRVTHSITGTDKNRDVLNHKNDLNFFNPKAGITVSIDETSNIYASFAIANKEPNRDDYVNAREIQPKPENLKNIELGYRTRLMNLTAGINGYGMFYDNQLVATGKVNESGEYLRENVKNSYRAGVEADIKFNLNRELSWGLTGSVSRNKVKNYTEFNDDYDNGGQISKSYKETDIAFSPSVIGSSDFSYRVVKGFDLGLLSKYVGKQYLDNTSNDHRKIDPFFVNDLRLRYNTSVRGVKNIGLTLLINNVLGEVYESNGYTFSYLYGGELATENYYYPQAGRNFLLQLSLKF